MIKTNMNFTENHKQCMRSRDWCSGGGLVIQSCPTLVTPWTVAHQASLSMGFSRQEYWKPARLLCPWDSPGKNTVVGCHFLLQRIFLTQESNPGLPHCRQMIYQLSYEGSPPIKNTGVGSLSLLQRIFPTQESNQGLLHCRQILYQLSYGGSTKN